MSENTSNSILLNKITASFESAILQTEEPFDLLTLTITKESLIDLLKFLSKEDLGFNFLTDITGIHVLEPTEMLGAVYHLHNMRTNQRIRLKAMLPKDNPTIASATEVFAGANWMERETYDFFGIIFEGHPNLKRILNVDDLNYFPLRKEYALEDPTRDDKTDTFFGR
jgi:NADH-quinone oxidoreductase subunit C